MLHLQALSLLARMKLNPRSTLNQIQ